MKTAIFIHGLHSDKNSTTGNNVKRILQQFEYTTITESFDVLNFDKTCERINELIKENNVSLAVGHSFGGFYAFLTNIKMILINPCLKPEIEIPKLLYEGEAVSELLSSKWMNARENFIKTLNGQDKQKFHAVFATDDDLFSYADYYQNELGFPNIHKTKGGHKIPYENLIPPFNKILNNEKYL